MCEVMYWLCDVQIGFDYFVFVYFEVGPMGGVCSDFDSAVVTLGTRDAAIGDYWLSVLDESSPLLCCLI
jgi:hypothetical protein